MISTNTQLPFHAQSSDELFEGSGIANLDAHSQTRPKLTLIDGLDAGFMWGVVVALVIVIVGIL